MCTTKTNTVPHHLWQYSETIACRNNSLLTNVMMPFDVIAVGTVVPVVSRIKPLDYIICVCMAQ